MTGRVDASGDRGIRVLTWNLWWRFGPWEQRREAVAAVLKGLAPDVCGLQEVWSVPGENFGASLAETLGMYLAWAPSPRQDWWQGRLDDPNVDIGNAVLSRWPMVEEDVLQLPAGGEADEGRAALHAAIEAPGGRLPFFTTQLNSAVDQSAVRCEQVRSLAWFVSERVGGEYPPVVTGDFNAEPDSDEVRLLCGHKTAPAVPGLVFVDAWRYADPRDPGWTWDPRNPHVRKTLEPGARIDYVLVGVPPSSGRGHVRSAGLIGAEPVDGVWPSDHAGVLVELGA